MSFVITYIFIFAKITQIATSAPGPAWERLAFTFLLFGVFGVATVETVRGVNSYARRKQMTVELPDVPDKNPPLVLSQPAPVQPNVSKPELKPTPNTAMPTPVPKGPRLRSGPDAYKDLTDQQVAEWAMEEADKINQMADECEQRMRSFAQENRPTTAEVILLTDDFTKCCAQDVRDLRAELLSRLGPPSKSPEEERTWETLTRDRRQGEFLRPHDIQRYAPHLRLLGLKLKRTVVPRKPAIQLHFSEKQVDSEKPDLPFKLITTIETESVISRGYIVVEMEGRFADLDFDLVDKRLVLDMKFIGNTELIEHTRKLQMAEYKGKHQAPSFFTLAISKKPFSPANPLHIVGHSKTPFHVAKVMLFDE